MNHIIIIDKDWKKIKPGKILKSIQIFFSDFVKSIEINFSTDGKAQNFFFLNWKNREKLKSYLNHWEGEDITNGEASVEVTVGVGVNKNDFGVKVIDDG